MRHIRLADAFPSSPEEFHLHDLAWKTASRLDPLPAGQEILEDKDTHLPNLRVVVFCDDDLIRGYTYLFRRYDPTASGVADLQAACKTKGFWLDTYSRTPTHKGHLGQLGELGRLRQLVV